jgi:hypothetical protein
MSAYDEWLDDVYGTFSIEGTVVQASRILKECDPIAYEIGKYNFEETANETEWDNA